ncbi:hypothetical protein Pr1d_33760 [Bythopirellula goksoeyrii]|uniref:Uncharacterized protein n=1 Tax=Bythopirellula goksoeyrii TaxID=1400387 RepID=A0A5B9QAP9_9BACT|nr:hypothetical protein Pr1d_33760 [Bythopirellula goksoeyrii]
MSFENPNIAPNSYKTGQIAHSSTWKSFQIQFPLGLAIDTDGTCSTLIAPQLLVRRHNDKSNKRSCTEDGQLSTALAFYCLLSRVGETATLRAVVRAFR